MTALSQVAADHTRVLVIGGGGFVGRHVCAAFAAAGYTVLAAAPRAAVDGPGVPLRLDLLADEPADVVGLLVGERIGVVVNAAGRVWNGAAAQMHRDNVILVERLVSVLSMMPWRCRLVHLGSVHEYGAMPPGASVDESAPTNPVTTYGRTKLLGSQAVLDASRAGQLDGVVLRATNVIGAGLSPASLLGQIAAQLVIAATAEDPVVRLPALLGRRDFLDCRDLADAVTAAAAAQVTGRVINVGSGRATAVRTLVTDLIKLSEVRPRVLEPEGAVGDVVIRSGAVDWQQADIRLAQRLLGWQPRRGLIDSLAILWDAARCQ